METYSFCNFMDAFGENIKATSFAHVENENNTLNPQVEVCPHGFEVGTARKIKKIDFHMQAIAKFTALSECTRLCILTSSPQSPRRWSSCILK